MTARRGKPAAKSRRTAARGVSVAGFRKECVSIPHAVEGAHMGHADFRVGGRIFASLYRADLGLAMVKLTPLQQREFADAHPLAFAPIKGGWGRQGATEVRLAHVSRGVLRRALLQAWRNAAPARLMSEAILVVRPKRR